MLPEPRTSEAQLSTLDRAATLALCTTLGDYGEAGALSHDLMLRAGRDATTRFAGDVDVLLAAARMYQLGGEVELARRVLLHAGKLAPEEARTLRQLGEVLRELGLRVAPALAIAEADGDVDLSASTPSSRPQSRARPASEDEGRPSEVREKSPSL